MTGARHCEKGLSTHNTGLSPWHPSRPSLVQTQTSVCVGGHVL